MADERDILVGAVNEVATHLARIDTNLDHVDDYGKGIVDVLNETYNLLLAIQKDLGRLADAAEAGDRVQAIEDRVAELARQVAESRGQAAG